MPEVSSLPAIALRFVGDRNAAQAAVSELSAIRTPEGNGVFDIHLQAFVRNCDSATRETAGSVARDAARNAVAFSAATHTIPGEIAAVIVRLSSTALTCGDAPEHVAELIARMDDDIVGAPPVTVHAGEMSASETVVYAIR